MVSKIALAFVVLACASCCMGRSRDQGQAHCGKAPAMHKDGCCGKCGGHDHGDKMKKDCCGKCGGGATKKGAKKSCCGTCGGGSGGGAHHANVWGDDRASGWYGR